MQWAPSSLAQRFDMGAAGARRRQLSAPTTHLAIAFGLEFLNLATLLVQNNGWSREYCVSVLCILRLHSTPQKSQNAV